VGGGCQVKHLLLLLLLLLAQGCISDDHPLCLGPLGVHGLFTANSAINQCDTVLALGCRFDERAACKSFDLWQTPRAVIHVDIRPQEVMSGSPKNAITCSVAANVEDFVGVLLQHLYGLLEERSKTLPGAAAVRYAVLCCAMLCRNV
jgi:thiamine pyrophosphate-dependent acetolactate synthase large subunit-like protein